jgi:hypothetical protein
MGKDSWQQHLKFQIFPLKLHEMWNQSFVKAQSKDISSKSSIH